MEINRKVSKDKLGEKIINYYKETKCLQLLIDDFESIKHDSGNKDNESFRIYYKNNSIDSKKEKRNKKDEVNYYNSNFIISRKDIQKILEAMFAQEGYELLNVDFGLYNNSDITCKLQELKDLKKQNKSTDLEVKSNWKVPYEKICQIITEYYNETKGIDLQIDSWQTLRSGLIYNRNKPIKFFYMDSRHEKSDLLLSVNDIKEILSKKLVTKGYELSNMKFDLSSAQFILNKSKALEKTQNDSEKLISNKFHSTSKKSNVAETDLSKEERNKLIYEYLTAYKTYVNEHLIYLNEEDKEYSLYHNKISDISYAILEEFQSIIGYTVIDPSRDVIEKEVADIISSAKFTQEQKKAISNLRNRQTFKKVMGDEALKQKSRLESLLGNKIEYKITYANEKGAWVDFKTEKQLLKELDTFGEKLDSLYESSAISKEEYENYDKCLDYIFKYYISICKGEQEQLEKRNNREFDEYEKNYEEKMFGRRLM